MRRFYVYIMTNHARTLYIGVTNDLERRVLEHKRKIRRGFTTKYQIGKLVWFEEFYDIEQGRGEEDQGLAPFQEDCVDRSRQPAVARFGRGLDRQRCY
jgi:putative endonuclease